MIRIYGSSRPWTVGAMNGAAANGRLDVVRKLHAERSEGCTVDAIIGAASNGHIQVVKWFSTRKNSLLRSAFVAVARAGDVEVYKMLRKSYDEAILWKTPNLAPWRLQRFSSITLREAWRQATSGGHIAMVEHLLAESPVQDVSLLLREAIGAGNVDLVRLLTSSGNPYSRGMLCAAAFQGHVDIVRLLLPKSDLDSINGAVAGASLYGHVEVVRLLLDKADPDTLGPALHRAASAGQVKTLKLLLDVWEDRPKKDPLKVRYITSAMKNAILNDEVEVATLLAARSGYYVVCPALRLAVIHNNALMVKELAKRSTPSAVIRAAAESSTRGQAIMVKLLLKYCDALTLELALEDAVSNGNIKTAKNLLEACDAQKSERILVEATARGCLKLVRLIQEGKDETKLDTERTAARVNFTDA